MDRKYVWNMTDEGAQRQNFFFFGWWNAHSVWSYPPVSSTKQMGLPATREGTEGSGPPTIFQPAVLQECELEGHVPLQSSVSFCSSTATATTDSSLQSFPSDETSVDWELRRWTMARHGRRKGTENVSLSFALAWWWWWWCCFLSCCFPTILRLIHKALVVFPPRLLQSRMGTLTTRSCLQHWRPYKLHCFSTVWTIW